MKQNGWSVELKEQTGRALEMYLAENGKGPDEVSAFVDQAVQARLFELTVDTVKRRNDKVPQAEIFDAIDTAARSCR